MTVEQRYTPGEIVTGTVTKIAPFGAFARIENGIEGLIHVTEIYPPTTDAKSTLKEGQEVQVRILRIESERRRLGLSMKAVIAPDAAVPLAEGDAGLAYMADEPTPTHSTPSADAIFADIPVAPTQNHARSHAPAPQNTPAPMAYDAPTTAFGAAFDAAKTRQSTQPQGSQDGTSAPTAPAPAAPTPVAEEAAPAPQPVDEEAAPAPTPVAEEAAPVPAPVAEEAAPAPAPEPVATTTDPTPQPVVAAQSNGNGHGMPEPTPEEAPASAKEA